MTSKHKILLVDDEPELIKSCQALLANSGFDVAMVTGGKEAIKILEQDDFDLLLLDLNMPDVGGYQVMEFINDNKLTPGVIVISGESTFDWVSKAFLLGAYDYIRKPYEFDALLITITNALKKRELENSFLKLGKQLEKSEKLHRFMIESSPDIIFIVDEEGHFAFANDRAEELLGYKKNELIGRHYSSIVAEESLKKAEFCFTERRSGDRATQDAEIWLKCKPGNKNQQLEQNKLAIELKVLGVYEHGDEASSNSLQDSAKGLSGTYVVARDITKRLASEKLIYYQAYHDLLTGLANRALFFDRLNIAISNARRKEGQLTVMFLDLDRFKVVNDTLGHSVGDKLLKQVAKRLKSTLREGDTLARFGGDEFVVLLPGVESEEIAQKVADKIIDFIKQPFMVDGHELFLTASIGVSMFPKDGDTAEALIKNSDIAMYYTKDLGKDGYHLYDGDMSVKHHSLLNMENDIRRGIKENQFEVFYQPQVNSINGQIVGMEALLRWNHPEKGLLSPAFFLSVAEESGLIVELGDWVLNSALFEMQGWREDGVVINKLGINFSHRQIEHKDFVGKIITALKKYDFPAASLEIEITENTLMSDIDNTIYKLRQLHKVGVTIAIDDFGTGYSSLSLLQKLPVNRLKIDRSFIQEMDQDSGMSIIEAIAHMAKGLKLEMVAEGVEEEYQVRYLRELDCPIIQGFIHSHALPADEMKEMIVTSESELSGQKDKAADQKIKYSA